jgi:putative phosphoribosyl transferase
MRGAPLFRNRNHAGQVLARLLQHMAGKPDVTVLALPRGGVPVGYEVARALNVGFDIFIVRKLSLPGDEELAIGAIATSGILVLNEDIVRHLHLTSGTIDRLAQDQQAEIDRQEKLYRQSRAPLPLEHRTVILIDDGLATGATMRAAARAVRMKAPARLVIAVPVAPLEVRRDLQSEADEVVCAATPEPFQAVGNWYESFPQTTDDEVGLLLQQARMQTASR